MTLPVVKYLSSVSALAHTDQCCCKFGVRSPQCKSGDVGIRYAYPAWIFASISTLESSGIISSGIGTRSRMGMPCSTIASCFMLQRTNIVSIRHIFFLSFSSIWRFPGSHARQKIIRSTNDREWMTYFDMDSIRSILVIPSQWRICNGNRQYFRVREELPALGRKEKVWRHIHRASRLGTSYPGDPSV